MSDFYEDESEERTVEKTYQKIDEDKAVSYISSGGALSKISGHFEERSVQLDLLRSIASVFNQRKIGVFEAGTGVGKSYAYLIPSVLWAVKNNERVVISTGTINLQQQLCEKDLPAVEKILGIQFKFILMKGRQNYICKRRLDSLSSVLDLFEGEIAEIKKIAEWASESETGSKSEMEILPSEGVWSKIRSESDACMGKKCPYQSDCFVMKVRKQALGANIIVVNHHLLFADIESRLESGSFEDAAVLPPYHHIVFDEAHGIESAATSFFSESLNRFKINRLVSQMYRNRRNAESGHIFTLAILSSNEEKAAMAGELADKIKTSFAALELLSKDLLLSEHTKRLCEKTARDFGPFLVSANALSDAIGAFADLIRVLMEGIAEDDKDFPAYWESKGILRHLDDAVILLRSFLVWEEKSEFVFWIQKKRLSSDSVQDSFDNEYIIFTRTPLDIASMMSGGVFEPMHSVVCTSATLRTGKDFSYWMRRTGVSYSDKDRLSYAAFDSPFPYKKNMLLAVPSDVPLPQSMDFQPYIEAAIPRLISAAQGRTLVLFTSYDSLKSAYSAVCMALRDFAGLILKQGDEDNARLLEKFKENTESVLFATDSFWQGVDVPGESLSQVIIVKLPFSVPNDPVFMARSEAVEKRGGSSFFELSVPEAVIKFRQGVGRLVRKSDDRGVVTVLDRRLFEKNYGRTFTASIPECKKIFEPLSDITKKINSFIFG